MAGRRIGIVWNPAKTEKDDLVAALPDDPDLSVSWYETEEDDPGKSAAEQAIADGAEVVIAAGGDGTVRAVAGHLAETGANVDLGIVPLGTGNLLARNLEVPLNDLEAAMDRAITGTPQSIDMGWVEITLPRRQRAPALRRHGRLRHRRPHDHRDQRRPQGQGGLARLRRVARPRRLCQRRHGDQALPPGRADRRRVGTHPHRRQLRHPPGRHHPARPTRIPPTASSTSSSSRPTGSPAGSTR